MTMIIMDTLCRHTCAQLLPGRNTSLANVYIATSIAARESLNKLKISALKELATECNIDTKKDIVSDLLNAQVPVEALTPCMRD
ncbi:hypothetical protein KUTeg_017600 [Tegillarca granosa]|uniref:Uncharacterized protein n=1 Tax=Tegillarca granosa TaxID=220873 RepID=A0ABQ9EKA0_TEGGR|nr:hypothetical protein KUTeg_017600 [Tegillarca granosa]